MTSSGKFSKLLEPGQIGSLRTKNRIIRSAAGVDYLDEEYLIIRELELPFFEAIARGGAGLVMIGSSVVNYPLGTCIQGQMRIDDDKFIPGFREITDTVHKYDCPMLLQILHAGAWHGIFNDGIQPVSSSDMSRSELQVLGTDFGMALRGLTVPEVKDIFNMFVTAAERAKKSGFDGVELNVASCHLGNSFLSPAWNKRHDEYGIDSLENRTRFVVEIIQEIKNRLGQDFAVGALMNGAEYGVDNGISIEDGKGIAQMLEKAGVDYLQVRAFGYGEYLDLNEPESIFFPEPPDPLGEPLDGSRQGAGIMVPVAAGIKEVVSVPIMAIGRLDAELGEEILEQGKADFIAMQRRLIADPELPNKIAEGRLDDIAPCSGCLACFGFMEHREHVRCRINATIGTAQDYAIDKAPSRKKVVVVGGGPGGMEAARVAALRGHEVILYEKERKLGGLLPLASLVKDPALENPEEITEYLKNQITKLGVDIKLGKNVTASTVTKQNPDVVIVATGGSPTVPEIPGIDSKNVIAMTKLHQMMKNYLRYLRPGALRSLTRLWMPIGKKVVIMGGGIHGTELAEFLVKAGRNVTIVDTADSLEDPRWPMVKTVRMFGWLAKNGVTLMAGVKYEGINNQGLTITTKEGEKQTIEADSIIPVMPLVPNDELANSLEGKVPEVFSIGDCSQDGLIIDAIADGYRAARGI